MTEVRRNLGISLGKKKERKKGGYFLQMFKNFTFALPRDSTCFE